MWPKGGGRVRPPGNDMTKIIERGMIFNGEMVRAILDGRKTQTRRIIKPQPEGTLSGSLSGMWLSRPLNGLLLPKIEDIAIHCPFGVVGDRIWVRETWAEAGASAPDLKLYRANYPAHVPLITRTCRRQRMSAGHPASTCRAGPAVFCWRSPMYGSSS